MKKKNGSSVLLISTFFSKSASLMRNQITNQLAELTGTLDISLFTCWIQKVHSPNYQRFFQEAFYSVTVIFFRSDYFHCFFFHCFYSV